MKKKQKKLSLHQKIKRHVCAHFHKHADNILHITKHMHHHLFHGLELMILMGLGLTAFIHANLTGLNQDLYRANSAEVAQELLTAIQNPSASLKQGNIISIWTMDTSVENTFAKGYCTYGAARISPEFFPYLDENTQQRTRGGNAVDRCKNASDTGYKIGSTPSQGALIIYDAGGRFGSYGHVGKVLHYDKNLKKIIVRDMARVARSTMSDRREDLTTANVKCYIYNSKTSDPEPQEVVTPETTPTVVAPTPPVVPVVTTPTHNAGNTTTPTVPVVPTPTTPTVTQPTTPIVIPQSTTNEKLSLTLSDLDDMAKHFMTQNDMTIGFTTKSPLKIGEAATLTITIKNKDTGEKYSGLLPFSFTILSTSNMFQPSIANIQLISNGSVDISISAKQVGTASIVITMDGVKIGEFSLQAK